MLGFIFALLLHFGSAQADDAVTEAPTAAPAATTVTAPTAKTAAPMPAPVVSSPAKETAIATPPVPPPPKAVASETAVGKVTQIFRDKKKIVVTLDSSAQAEAAPRSLVFTSAKGEACEGLVEQAQGDKVFVDFSGCANFEQITAGSKLTRPVFQTFVPPEEMPAHEVRPDREAEREFERSERKPSRWNHIRPSFSLGYDTSSQAHFSNVDYTAGGSTVSGSENLNVAAAGDISLGVMWARERGWGFLGNLTFQSARNIKGGTFRSDGATTDFTYDSPQPTMKFTVWEANALYRFGFMYLPFGLNYTTVTVNATPSDEWIQASGGLGGQVGVGFIVGEFFHFEVLSQFLAVSVKSAGFGTSTDLGNGSLSGLVLRAGVVF